MITLPFSFTKSLCEFFYVFFLYNINNINNIFVKPKIRLNSDRFKKVDHTQFLKCYWETTGCRMMILDGSPGMGNSCLCKKYLQDWIDSISDKEKYMTENFDLL